MLNILKYFKFNSVLHESQLNKKPIFCFDFIQGFALISIMLNILILISLFKPLLMNSNTTYCFVFLVPMILFIANITYEIYGDNITRNIIGWSIPFLVIFGILVQLISLTPHPIYFHKQSQFNTVFNYAPLTAIILSILIFFIQSVQNTFLLFSYKISYNKFLNRLYKFIFFILTNIISVLLFYYLYFFLNKKNTVIHLPNISTSLFFQVIISVLLFPLIQPIIKWVRLKENLTLEDRNLKAYRYNWISFFITKNDEKLKAINEKIAYRPRFIFNYLCGLAMAYMMFMLVSGTTVLKLISIPFFTLPAGVLFVPFIYSCSNVMTEIYGYAISRNMLWWYVFVSLLFTLLGMFIAYLPSPNTFTNNDSYQFILGNMPRIFLAGTLGTICGLTANNMIVSKLKKRLNGYHYWLRSIVSTCGGELVYNIIAYPIMFLGLVTIHQFINIFISVSLFKLVMTACVWPLECYIAKKLKFMEQANVYDFDVIYSIFHLSTKKNILNITKID